MSGSKTEPQPQPRPGEFELIDRLFVPLARDAPGALNLADDVALLAPPPGQEIVLKTDSLVESVHFRHDDPPGTVGRKALRRALSDLAAKGARLSAYLLALALPPWPDMAWLDAFADGLAADQSEFGVCLVGGETDATPGPVVITITAVGFVRAGTLVRRKGAKPGDLVFVTGTIGDAGGGLSVLAGGASVSDEAARDFLISRYRLPVPRLAFGQALHGAASAAIDVSDGLLADLAHIADVSGVRIEIDALAVPLSDPLRRVWGDSVDARVSAATAGDDYEIAFTAPPGAMNAVRQAAQRTATAVTQIGRVVANEGIAFLDESGREIAVKRRGYTHF